MGFKGKSISVASYDAGNRLTAWNRAGADENHSQTWNYDNAGNWNSTTKDGDTESRDHSVSDQITQLDGNPVSHDLKGNLTKYKYGRKNYKVKYDLDNRIFSVKSNRRKVTYRYDAFGRRIISKKNGNRTALIWWGDSECAEYKHRDRQRVVQHDIMGHPTRLNSVIARDTARGKRKVKLQWYHKNYLDHVYAVSDDNGNLVEHYRYTAFGEPEIYSATGARRNTSAIANTVMWNTRRYDADNGLYYYKYRHYAANIGRWPSRDPIEERGGVNLYGFAFNSPISWIDVLGNAPKRVSGGFSTDNGHSNGENNFFDGVADKGAGGKGKGKKTPSGKSILDALKDLSKGNCCIEKVTIAGHGWAGPADGPGIPGKASGSGLYEDGAAGDKWATGADSLRISDIKKSKTDGSTKWCDPCTIEIHACSISRTFTAQLAAATGCTVVAAGGGCDIPKGSNQWRSTAQKGDKGNNPSNQFHKTEPNGTQTNTGHRYKPK